MLTGMPTAFYSARGPRAVLLVLGLHGLLLLVALQLTVWRDRVPRQRAAPALTVGLLPLPSEAPAAARRSPSRDRAARAQAAPLQVRTLPARVSEPQPITQPITQPIVQPTQPTAPLADTPPRAALDLRLPRGASAPWRARNPVLDDERANTNPAARQTIEARIAAALGGSDQITEERLDDGRIRLRRGRQCVVAHPNRAERLDPFNASVLPKLRGLEKC